MAEPSTFRGTLDFFSRLGIYDVVLPFLLVFTIVFAILEKTKVFGYDKVGEVEVTKKNLNAITAFVIAFFTIASSRLVETITSISSNVVLLLLISIFFLMLVGSFYQQTDKGFFLEGGWRNFFVILMFLGLVLIFLNALKVGEKTLLMWIIDNLADTMTSTGVAAVVLFAIVVGLLFFITWSPKPTKS
ncbi:MAG: hypothetical protein V1702_00245 [Candidatus Woesearchaeota archaeon]